MTAPGEQLGPYTIAREIGRGGMGVVYLGRDTRLDRDVAIKSLPEELAQDADRLARFEREAKTLAALNHTNVAGIFGVEEADGHRYLILEYVEGETLAYRLVRGPLPVDEALEVAIEIASGVEAAHDAGVIHRDLKPDNIKLTPDGKVKVLDFGLARSEASTEESSGELADSPTLTSPARHSPTIPGAILGTAAYMSPEQARGRPIDKRTDIWSFGVILYEMLTGTSPFSGQTASDSIGAVLHKEIELDRLPPASPALRHVLLRCLARDRDKRYRDIGDVRMDLELAGSGGSGSGASPASGQGQSSGIRFATAGTLLGAAAVALMAWILWPAAEPQTVRRLDLGVSGRAADAPQTPAISPDGSRVVYRHLDRLWVRGLSRFETRELAGTEGAVAPFWSPDGSWIGFAQGRYLMKMPADGGRPERIATMLSAMAPAGYGAWLADGTIVFAAGVGELYSVPAGGGRPEVWLSLAPDEEDFHDVAPLPDRHGVVFVSHTKVGPWKIGVFDGTRRADVTEVLGTRATGPVYSEPGFIIFGQQAPSAGLWAVAFDIDAFTATGKPFLIAGDGTRASVSSDGTLAYLRNTAGRDYVLTWVPLDGSPVEPFGAPMSILSHPALSPDRSRIAHVGGAEASDLLVYDISNGTRTVIAHGIDGAAAPKWSPDGDRIAVSREFEGTRRISFFSADGSGQVGEDLEGEWASFDEGWASATVERSAAILDPATPQLFSFTNGLEIRYGR